jgi:4-hydroxybenzoate polyprenyltransferase
MKRRMNGLIRLTRYKEYPFFVIVTSLLGAAAAHGVLGWRLLGILAANVLAVAFAFMINDVEDAPDDALNSAKVKRNPVSAADLSARTGRLASFCVAITAGLVFAILGIWPFIYGLSCLVVAYLYSWRRVRLKSKPFVDLVSHGLMLAGLQFLSAYFTFEAAPFSHWVFPFLFVVGISLYGELINELRDLEGDKKAGIVHTANLIGQRAAYWLMMTLLLIGVSSGVITIFINHIVPTWVLLAWVAFAVILVLPKVFLLRQHSSLVALQESFHKPIEIAAAFALLLQFVSPWAVRYWASIFFHGG